MNRFLVSPRTARRTAASTARVLAHRGSGRDGGGGGSGGSRSRSSSPLLGGFPQLKVKAKCYANMRGEKPSGSQNLMGELGVVVSCGAAVEILLGGQKESVPFVCFESVPPTTHAPHTHTVCGSVTALASTAALWCGCGVSECGDVFLVPR